MIKKLIADGIITSSQARSIEIFIIGTLFSLLFGVIDNLEIIMNGGQIDWSNFLFAFIATTSSSIVAGMKKYLRDKQKELLE